MKYLDLAVRVAKANYVTADHKHFLFGAVCLRKDGAVVVSSNIRTTDPSVNAHAESRILRKAGHGAILWLARVDRHGKWAMSKPCPNCSTLIVNRNVKRVYYTVEDNVYAVWDV